MSMELDNVFSVPTTPAQAWEVLLDVERIAPCMPGATVEEFDGEVVTGRIKVKVGPVSLTYRGTAKFIERDSEAQVVVLEASGKETRGAGTASATVRASLEPEASGDSTRVVIHTTMNVTGRPAQFGRGVIAEVGGKLVEKFADNLAQLISDSNAPSADASTPPAEASAVAAADTGAADTGTDASPAAVTPAAARPTASAAATPAAVKGDDSLNLVRLVGPAILKRVVPVAAVAAALALLGRRFRHLLRRGARKG
ncbi:MAG TPA: SRPBCC family protein [Streptosporangiaceae bacterium]|jgi:carbon monoxide dehydrogenase subunit G